MPFFTLLKQSRCELYWVQDVVAHNCLFTLLTGQGHTSDAVHVCCTSSDAIFLSWVDMINFCWWTFKSFRMNYIIIVSSTNLYAGERMFSYNVRKNRKTLVLRHIFSFLFKSTWNILLDRTSGQFDYGHSTSSLKFSIIEALMGYST